jgi:PAS domain S-box-containing protein
MPHLPFRQELLPVVLESAPMAIVVVNQRGEIVLVNEQTEQLFGYQRHEMIGKSVEMLVPESSRERHPHFRTGFMSDARKRAMGAGRDLYGLRKDGSAVPVEIGLTPVETEDGTFVLSAVVDITERKRAEERFRIAVEASPNAMVMVDPDGRIVLVNSQTEHMFGYSRDELMGQSVEILVPDRLRDRHPSYRAGFFAVPEPRPMGAGRDLYGMRKDGVEVPVEIGLSPIRTESGVMVLSAIVDITERKKAEEALAHQTAELARSNAELEQFAYVASHDLQEPLRAVAGCLQILEQRSGDKFDIEDSELVDHAVEGASRMQQLIDDLLTYSRLGTREPSQTSVDLTEVVTLVLHHLGPAIAEQDAEIDVGELPVVIADRTQMVQLFQNLIANSLKYRSADPPRVRIGYERESDSWLFSVADNGIGIESRYFDRIFRVFQRLHTRQHYPGTGIGLAICKRIVDRHGGEIWLDSAPGKGSTFFFTLPVDGATPQARI